MPTKEQTLISQDLKNLGSGFNQKTLEVITEINQTLSTALGLIPTVSHTHGLTSYPDKSTIPANESLIITVNRHNQTPLIVAQFDNSLGFNIDTQFVQLVAPILARHQN